jgi:hypothetical protein
MTGCHDMAANGREWTRSISGPIRRRPQSTVDFAKFDANEYVFMRAKSYLDDAPYLFRDADVDSMKGGKASKDIGFRIVIEIPENAFEPLSAVPSKGATESPRGEGAE